MQNGIFLFLIKNKVSKKRSILDPLQTKKKLADPDPITCDPGSRVHDPDPEAPRKVTMEYACAERQSLVPMTYSVHTEDGGPNFLFFGCCKWLYNLTNPF